MGGVFQSAATARMAMDGGFFPFTHFHSFKYMINQQNKMGWPPPEQQSCGGLNSSLGGEHSNSTLAVQDSTLLCLCLNSKLMLLIYF